MVPLQIHSNVLDLNVIYDYSHILLASNASCLKRGCQATAVLSHCMGGLSKETLLSLYFFPWYWPIHGNREPGAPNNNSKEPSTLRLTMETTTEHLTACVSVLNVKASSSISDE